MFSHCRWRVVTKENGRADPCRIDSTQEACRALYFLLTAFFSSAPGVNFATFRAAILIVAPSAGCAVPCLPLGDRESAETNQGYPIPFPEGSSDAVHGCINRSIRLRLADFTCARNLVNEIGFIHFFS